MGASSHVTIFGHISQSNAGLDDSTSLPKLPTSSPLVEPYQLGLEAEMEALKVATCMKQLLNTFAPDSLSQLLAFWRATRANLTLAEPLIDVCRGTLEDLEPLSSTTTANSDPHLDYARGLLCNSALPLVIHAQLTFEEFCSQFLEANARLETIGLIFCAVIRAASEIQMFPPLYVENSGRRNLISLAAKLANTIVEATLSIDQLNDLQLIMQYENFISHSFVFGVQSYHSFRKLGDVITSVISLGYHETLDSPEKVPLFLINLRKTALCRAYSADKNWAVFLGRPPRLPKRYCNLYAAIGLYPHNELSNDFVLEWGTDTEMSIWAETRWTSTCASLKEEILELFRDDKKQNFDNRVSISELRRRADEYWNSLPHTFRMEGTLKGYNAGAWSRDFIMNLLIGTLSLSSSLPGNAMTFIVSDFRLGLQDHDPLLATPISFFLIGYVFGPLVFAPLSESYGRQRLLFVAFVAYTGFTLGCSLAPTWTSLLVFRLFAGISGSAPLAIVPGIIADMYKDPLTRGRAVASFMTAVVVAPLMAPSISGALSEISWRWVFWASFILAAVTLVPLMFLSETHGQTILRRRNRVRSRKNDSPEDSSCIGCQSRCSNDLGTEISVAAKKEHDWRSIFTVILLRPLRMLTTELIAATICFYLAIIYAIFYMYFQVLVWDICGVGDGRIIFHSKCNRGCAASSKLSNLNVNAYSLILILVCVNMKFSVIMMAGIPSVLSALSALEQTSGRGNGRFAINQADVDKSSASFGYSWQTGPNGALKIEITHQESGTCTFNLKSTKQSIESLIEKAAKECIERSVAETLKLVNTTLTEKKKNGN
ncbi:Fungal transcriptional regulatory protein, N-terminal [Paramyrothecium foliicola]|nr:Fungal transcriptional regulatory protein, N-terminal [Paramyrothecium foliicola]